MGLARPDRGDPRLGHVRPASRSRARRSRGGSRRGPSPRAPGRGRARRTRPRCRGARPPPRRSVSLAAVPHRPDLTSCLTGGMSPSPPTGTRRANGRVAMLVAAVAWSTAGLAQRELDATPATQVLGRALFAFLALLVVVAVTERSGVIVVAPGARPGRRRRSPSSSRSPRARSCSRSTTRRSRTSSSSRRPRR